MFLLIIRSMKEVSTGGGTVRGFTEGELNLLKADIEEWIQQDSLHDLKEKIDAYFSQQK